MLAYVFWHQRSGEVTREEYQAKLIAFHRAVQEQQPQGFLCSLVLETPQLRWMTEARESYEDWYIVENSAALDVLDAAAVTGICQEPHNQLARLADNGTGGLYRLKGASVDMATLSTIRHSTWFSKPSDMNYERLYALLHQSQVEEQGMLWQRQMTMGPASEFCLHSPLQGRLSEEIKSVQVEAQPIFVPDR